MVLGAFLAAVVVVIAIAITQGSAARPTALRLSSPIGAVFHRSIELQGACAEARVDHGHDVDPSGLVDQENDECFPAQHAKRAPDGRVIGG